MKGNTVSEAVWALTASVLLLLPAGCGSRSGEEMSGILPIASNLVVKVRIEKDDLGGTTLRINGSTGSALYLDITNSNPQQLRIGSDLLLHAVSGSKEECLSILMQLPKSSEDETSAVARKRAFALQCDWLLGFSGDQLMLMLYGCNGQAFAMAPLPEYRGKWPAILAGRTPQQWVERIMGDTEGIDWVVTPAISTEHGTKFRLLLPVKIVSEARVIPVSRSGLKAWVCDNQNPLWLREAGVGWLILDTDGEAWRDLASMLNSTEQDVRIRQSCARWLAVAGPPQALTTIDQVLWDRSSSNTLARSCYYALTWCPHPEAKAFISKAAGHPDAEIKESAQKTSKSSAD